MRREKRLRANFMADYTVNLMACKVTVPCGIRVETTEELGEGPIQRASQPQGTTGVLRATL